MPPPSPYDDPPPRGWKLVQGTLRVTVALQCLGLAAMAMRGRGGALFPEWLRESVHLPGDVWQQATSVAPYVLMGCGLVALLRPIWLILGALALWQAVLATTPIIEKDAIEQILFRGADIAAPLVLMLVDFWPPALAFSIGRAQASLVLLRLAIVAALAGHGWIMLLECRQPGEWTAWIKQGMSAWAAPDAITPLQVLVAAGAIDLALGLNILLARTRPVLLVAAVWGAALAATPMIAEGTDAFPLFFSRSALVGAPLAMFCYWFWAVREQPAVIVPA